MFISNISFFESFLENEKDNTAKEDLCPFLDDLQDLEFKIQEKIKKIFSKLRNGSGRLNFFNDNELYCFYEFNMKQTV